MSDTFLSIKSAYDLLMDEQSRYLFWARLMADSDDELNCLKIFYQHCGDTLKRGIQNVLTWVDEFAQAQYPVYIYGAKRYGKLVYAYLKERGVRVCAFVDRDYAVLQTCCGLPVFSLEKLCEECTQDGYVFVASNRFYSSIVNDLIKNNFPQSRMLPALFLINNISEQYFEFMDRMPAGGAFIDGGCYDFSTSFAFIDHVQSQYSKIFAFEPDPNNYNHCLGQIHSHHVLGAELIQAGLGKAEQILPFQSDVRDAAASMFDRNGTSFAKVVSLDEIGGDEQVSFIKLDVEGFELDALMGAEQIIQRDKPLCAISVYHKRGDLLAIMKYLSQIVPEYRFAIRHYTSSLSETVLYAFCEEKPNEL